MVLRCVVKPRRDAWIGCCLELCLISVGDTAEEAKTVLRDMIRSCLDTYNDLTMAGETVVPVAVPHYFVRRCVFDLVHRLRGFFRREQTTFIEEVEFAPFRLEARNVRLR